MIQEDVRTHTAVHVLKGAVQKVLGAKWTASTFVEGRHGRLTVQFDRKPSEEDLKRVEEEANRKIAEGSEVLEFEMERKEAEMHFGDAMYDLFPVPATVTMLKIVRIPDWNLNCCVERHVESTSLVGPIRLGRTRFRKSRKELEVEFELADLTAWNR
ncbi:MAG TPA: alanyl-tRNA editing protein [Nitrososphaerales archaeon]|nr:alanyl-tRNA editing protein [Nitrososphaerales archaeon]